MSRDSVVVAILILFFAVPSVLASGPYDAEVGVSLWFAELSADWRDITGNSPSYSFSDSDTKIEYWAQFWVSRWGGKIKYYEYGYRKDDWSVDLRYKVWNRSDDSFLAVGLGFETDRSTLDGDHRYRLLAEGFLPLGKIVSGYGEAVFTLDSDDLDWNRGEDDHGDGSRSEWEVELGLEIRAVRFLNLRAGYRRSVSTVESRGVAQGLPVDTRGEYVSSGFIVSASYVF